MNSNSTTSTLARTTTDIFRLLYYLQLLQLLLHLLLVVAQIRGDGYVIGRIATRGPRQMRLQSRLAYSFGGEILRADDVIDDSGRTRIVTAKRSRSSAFVASRVRILEA